MSPQMPHWWPRSKFSRTCPFTGGRMILLELLLLLLLMMIVLMVTRMTTRTTTRHHSPVTRKRHRFPLNCTAKPKFANANNSDTMSRAWDCDAVPLPGLVEQDDSRMILTTVIVVMPGVFLLQKRRMRTIIHLPQQQPQCFPSWTPSPRSIWRAICSVIGTKLPNSLVFFAISKN